MSERTTEHAEIWLEPYGAPDRCWCEDNQWGDEGVRYVLAAALKPSGDAGELCERLDSHMGLADMQEVLRDCRLARTLITTLVAENERLGEQIQRMEYTDGDAEHWRHLATTALTTRDAARENFLTMQGAAAQLLNRATTLERQLATAREALEPFAEAADDAERLSGHDGPLGQYIAYDALCHAREVARALTPGVSDAE